MVMHVAEFCSKTLIAMKNNVFNIIFFIMEIAASKKVYWELKTPVVFGDSATLTCIVDQDNNCDSAATRRWDGGRNNTILMLNGHSTNASKYNEVADEPCHNFSLIIMDFGMNDFTDYKCTFEFQTSRQTLTLDARYFIGIPSEDNISFSLDQMQTNLSLEIQFHKVYPIPKCTVKIEHDYWFDNFTDAKPNGKFFDATLLMKTNVQRNQCHQNVTGICALLSFTVLQFNTILNCTETSIQFGQKQIILISVVILNLLTMLIVCLIICRTLTDKAKIPAVHQMNEPTHRRIQEASNGNDSYNSSIEDVSEREKGNFDLIEIFESNNFTYETQC